jgi:hypothetical protein
MSPTLPDRPLPPFDAHPHGGPHDGTRTRVAALPSGRPTEFLSSHDDDRGLYVPAGAPDTEGALPYWWMTWVKAGALRGLRLRQVQAATRAQQVP